MSDTEPRIEPATPVWVDPARGDRGSTFGAVVFVVVSLLLIATASLAPEGLAHAPAPLAVAAPPTLGR